jgi:hypothetical protein
MTKEKKMAEHREDKRSRVFSDAFVALGPHFNKVGRLIDIHMDGLEFHYMARKELSDRSFEIDIFLTDGDFYLEKVPCETLADMKTRRSGYTPFTMRQCTVQFGDLSPDQRTQLEYFIRKYTLDEMIA